MNLGDKERARADNPLPGSSAMRIKHALLTAACLILISLTSGCATFNEMARQRGEAMDACQGCPCCQCCQSGLAQNCLKK